MKNILIILINLIIRVITIILIANISYDAAKLILISYFLFLLIRLQHNYFFFSYFIVLLLSDSRILSLSFVAEIKPIISILFYLAISIFLYKNNYYKRPIRIYLYYYFIFFSFLSLIYGFNFIVFQKTISYLLLFLIVPNYFLVLFNKKNILILLCYFLLAILLAGGIFYFINPDLVFLKGRFRGIFGNPNGLGIYCLLFFFIFHLLTKSDKDFIPNKIKLLINFIIIINILFSQSRSCLFAIFIFYAFNFLLNYSPSIAIFFSLFSIVIFGFISVNFYDTIKYLNIDNFIRINTFENASGRYIAWSYLFNQFNIENIFIGNGIGSTEILFNNKYSFLSKLGHEGNAHNSFLTIWYDTGFFGLLSFIAFISNNFIFFKNFNKNIPIFFGIFLSAFFESWLSASLNPFTILFLIILVLINHTFINIEEVYEKSV